MHTRRARVNGDDGSRRHPAGRRGLRWRGALGNRATRALLAASRARVQRVLTLGGVASNAIGVATDASGREGYGAWDAKTRLQALEGSPHTIDFTWIPPAGAGAGHYTVTVNGAAVAGAHADIDAAVAAAEGKLAGLFVSLAADVGAGRYRVTAAASDKIRKRSAESPFARSYSGGKAVADAVEEAIAAMARDGTSRVAHTRLDSQPTGEDNYNFQVQLGGSAGDYRRTKGDTSETLVVVPTEFFNAQHRADPDRWRQVLQAAHRQSFANTQRIEIGP